MRSPFQVLYDYFERQQLWKRTLELKRGDQLHLPGDQNDSIYYLEKGSLYSAIIFEEGREQVIRFGYSGDFITALDTFIDGRNTLFSTRALQRTILKTVDRTTYLAAFHQDPALEGQYDVILKQLILGQMEREIDLLTVDATQRYQRVWKRSPRLFQEIPAKYIANYLRMTPETLSRIRAAEL